MITSTGLGYMGQLGNQMFQYSTLVGLRAKLGYELGIPSGNLVKRGSVADIPNKTYISYGLSLLDCFDLNESLLSDDAVKKAIKWTYQEPHHHFDPRIFTIPDETNVVGFFETEKYFEHATEEIRERFTFKPEVVKLAEKQWSELSQKNRRNLALHVRRGQDRPGIQDFHPYMTIDYYKKALEMLPDRNVLVFTDDFEWSRTHFPEATIVPWVKDFSRPDFVDLKLMTMCDDHIIANSTFSWWGAWLARSRDQVVIAPKQWFGPGLAHKSTHDTIPSRWIRI